MPLKIIFLDIDGVLNCDTTKEKFCNFTGVDVRLRDMYLEWFDKRNYVNVLSSSWRIPTAFGDFKGELLRNGLSWICETPRCPSRGRGVEIQAVLDMIDYGKYVILDDMGPSEFLKHQRPWLVQTSAHKGLEPKKLALIDKLMGWDDGAGEVSCSKASV